MKSIFSISDDPYYNLALEEYLLKNFSDEFFLLYSNKASVVIGKHQNAMAEVNMDYLEEKGIVLARRISGGGAVYHDPGNLNYTFITNEKPGNYIQFRKYTAPIIEALKKINIEAKLGKRNEILVTGKKISGTASHVFKDRVMHHGTLLVNTDLGRLEHCLYTDRDRYQDKAVRSVRSEVINLQSLLDEDFGMQQFSRYIYEAVRAIFNIQDHVELTDLNLASISKLIEEKFSDWSWNFGYSPKYSIIREINGKKVEVIVLKGVISEIISEDDKVGNTLAKAFVNTRHTRRELEKKLELLGVEDEKDYLLSFLF